WWPPRSTRRRSPRDRTKRAASISSAPRPPWLKGACPWRCRWRAWSSCSRPRRTGSRARPSRPASTRGGASGYARAATRSPARTATHLAADLNKLTAIPGQPRLRAMSLVDNIPLVSALVNDDGWDNVYTEQLATFYRPGDVLITISVHGGQGRDKAGAWSQNL